MANPDPFVIGQYQSLLQSATEFSFSYFVFSNDNLNSLSLHFFQSGSCDDTFHQVLGFFLGLFRYIERHLVESNTLINMLENLNRDMCSWKDRGVGKFEINLKVGKLSPSVGKYN